MLIQFNPIQFRDVNVIVPKKPFPETSPIHIHTDTREFEFGNEIMLSGTQDAGSNQVQGRTRILPASEVLLSLAGSGSPSRGVNIGNVTVDSDSAVIDVKLTSWLVGDGRYRCRNRKLPRSTSSLSAISR